VIHVYGLHPLAGTPAHSIPAILLHHCPRFYSAGRAGEKFADVSGDEAAAGAVLVAAFEASPTGFADDDGPDGFAFFTLDLARGSSDES
jgi:hypothetical protein